METGALDRQSVSSEITVLFQDYLQYHLPVADNIAFGRIDREHGPEDLVEAARRAGAHDFVTRLSNGYDTRLGLQFEGGHELSVGQWQRLALARAFYRGGSLLILDEPTAALDPRAERDLFQQIRALTEGQATLLISHRFSTRALGRPHLCDGLWTNCRVGRPRRVDGPKRGLRRAFRDAGGRLPRHPGRPQRGRP